MLLSPVSVGVAAINVALNSGEIDKLHDSLLNPDVKLVGVVPEYMSTYYSKLISIQTFQVSASAIDNVYPLDSSWDSY